MAVDEWEHKAREVLRARNFYGVLGVDRSATSAEITRAYRKRAMKFHPDKNPRRAELASEVFKKVTSAYSCLSDAEKRRFYDATGSESPQQHGMRQRQHAHMHMHHADVDDLFRAFFGHQGGPFMYTRRAGPFQRQHFFRQQRPRAQPEERPWTTLLLQFLPLIVLLLSQVFTAGVFSSSNAAAEHSDLFRLKRERGFSRRQQSQLHRDEAYFVPRDFLHVVRDANMRQQIDSLVHRAYLNKYASECHEEYRKAQDKVATGTADKQDFLRASDQYMDYVRSCQKYQESLYS
ncbi:MAG: hypothetical protein MHM6MM_000865 [Cercozoa sp. M6MM]